MLFEQRTMIESFKCGMDVLTLTCHINTSSWIQMELRDSIRVTWWRVVTSSSIQCHCWLIFVCCLLMWLMWVWFDSNISWLLDTVLIVKRLCTSDKSPNAGWRPFFSQDLYNFQLYCGTEFKSLKKHWCYYNGSRDTIFLFQPLTIVGLTLH